MKELFINLFYFTGYLIALIFAYSFSFNIVLNWLIVIGDLGILLATIIPIFLIPYLVIVSTILDFTIKKIIKEE
jgi:hypothetical protein